MNMRELYRLQRHCAKICGRDDNTIKSKIADFVDENWFQRNDSEVSSKVLSNDVLSFISHFQLCLEGPEAYETLMQDPQPFLQKNAVEILQKIDQLIQDDCSMSYFMKRFIGSQKGVNSQAKLRLQKLPLRLQNALAVMELFIKSNCTSVMFTRTVGITTKKFNLMRDLVREHAPEVAERVNKVMEANEIKYHRAMSECTSRTARNIIEGTTHDNGKVTPFTIFDYHITEYPEFDNLIAFAHNINKAAHLVMIRFKERNIHSFKFLDRNNCIMVKHIINGNEVTQQDKESVFEFLREQKLECTSGNYDGALRYFLQNQKFPEVRYGAEYKREKEIFYNNLKQQYDNIQLKTDDQTNNLRGCTS